MSENSDQVWENATHGIVRACEIICLD